MEPQINFISLAIATFIPMIVGFIYYHPVLFGKFWMAANNFTKESLGSGPKPLQFVAVLITSFMLAFFMWGWVTGGGGMDQFQVTDPTDGHSHVTFGHGVFHGIAMSLLVVFPILSSGAVFEKRSLTWVWVNTLYWMITISLMGGILSAWR